MAETSCPAVEEMLEVVKVVKVVKLSSAGDWVSRDKEAESSIKSSGSSSSSSPWTEVPASGGNGEGGRRDALAIERVMCCGTGASGLLKVETGEDSVESEAIDCDGVSGGVKDIMMNA